MRNFTVLCGLTGPLPLLTHTTGGSEELGDRIVSALGSATFFRQLAKFPVNYLDDKLAVFTFPPLNSRICIRLVQG